MSVVFAPTLSVQGRTIYHKVRKVPPGASICVKTGDVVAPADVVAQAKVQGQIHSIAAAQQLGVSRARLNDYLKCNVGDEVKAHEILGQKRSLWGLFYSEFCAPVSGKVETISTVSGHVMIREVPVPVTVNSFLGGTVVSIDNDDGVCLSKEVSLVQGAFGVGGEVVAPLCEAGDNVAGKVVCFFQPIDGDLLRKIRENGAKGVIASSIDGGALLAFCGDDINLAATGDEEIGLTLVLTEGFGSLPMAHKTKQVLAACIGKEISMCGVTQVRAGVIRPEIIGPPVDGLDAPSTAGGIGAVVKITRGPYLGQEATIEDVPLVPQTLESGVTALTYLVRLHDSERRVHVPRPNVE